MRELLAATALIVGSLFTLLAAIGVLRLPDTLSRMQAATKATTLGVGASMLGVAFAFGEWGAGLRAAAIVVLLYITAPVGAHALARAVWLTDRRAQAEGEKKNESKEKELVR